jgi:hypothetical protein
MLVTWLPPHPRRSMPLDMLANREPLMYLLPRIGTQAFQLFGRAFAPGPYLIISKRVPVLVFAYRIAIVISDDSYGLRARIAEPRGDIMDPFRYWRLATSRVGSPATRLVWGFTARSAGWIGGGPASVGRSTV